MVSFSTLHPDIKISLFLSWILSLVRVSEKNGKSGATARDERTNERNQKNAGISGEINVMRQFDSSRNGEGEEAWGRVEETEGRKGGNRDRECYRLPQSFVKLLVSSRCLLP